jgi:hypothetical protein
MQFKHPEILYFLFLLVLPILVHLFQLRRFKKEYFTNVQFLKELSIQTRKSSKLKKWLLLLTRLLIMSALILAFAQPFFDAKDKNNVSNEMFIILDNSFSMQAKGQKGELLRRTIEDLLEHTPENQNFSLITNNQTFWNTDIKSIQKDLQNLKYSASKFDLDNQIAKIKARKSNFKKDIIVITDAVGLKVNQLKSEDENLNTFFIIPKAEKSENVSVDSVYINQTLDKFYEIGLKLTVFGDDKKEIPIALYNQNKLIAKTLLKFENNQKSINFTIPKEDFKGYFSITDNSLDYDNNLYFSISKPEKINVISIGETEKSLFLSKIYNQNEFNFSNFELKSLDYNILEKQDAIVLNEITEIPQALQTTLKSFVEKGGNLVFIPSEKCSIPNCNAFLNNFRSIQFKNLEVKQKLITKIAFENPLYNGVFEKKIINFQYPSTKISFGLTTSNPTILSFEDQSIFLTSIQNLMGKVFVFSTPLNKQNSNFLQSPLVVPTIYNMAQNTQKTGICAFTIGNNNALIIDANLSKDEIVNLKNTSKKFGESFIPIQQILNKKVKLTFTDYPEEAGNFGAFTKDHLLKNVSFNFDRTESNLAEPNLDLLKNFKKIETIETLFDTIQADRTNNEIWKWFVVLTLLFLIAELLIQKIVK